MMTMERVELEIERLLGALQGEAPIEGAGPRANREWLVRLWSLRWGLSRGTRRRYLTLATLFDLAGHGALRDVVYHWATDDDCHERVAEAALWDLSADAVEAPLDATLWDAYLDAIVVEQPWLTCGAMGAWEELAATAIELGEQRAARASRLPVAAFSDRTSRWEELTAALRGESLDADEMTALVDGISTARVMGLRMVRWALGRDEAEVDWRGRGFFRWTPSRL
jgi:hypothetical protein